MAAAFPAAKATAALGIAGGIAPRMEGPMHPMASTASQKNGLDGAGPPANDRAANGPLANEPAQKDLPANTRPTNKTPANDARGTGVPTTDRGLTGAPRIGRGRLAGARTGAPATSRDQRPTGRVRGG
jgi:hypothetical protein